jgi:hypothetical protein
VKNVPATCLHEEKKSHFIDFYLLAVLPLAYVNSENYKSIDVVRSVFTILLHKTT